MTKRQNWVREELLLAINLYCQIPFGQIHSRNPKIIELAKKINRTPGAVAWKLVNFAHIDPSLARQGASHVSKLDREVWNEFFEDWDSLAFESECLQKEIREPNHHVKPREGKDVERTVRVRINQNFFRQMILASYDYRCCLTGLSIPELLVASHIKPWAADSKNRTNPQNGLCLNSLHDKAFDRGLITLSDSYRVIVSEKIKKLQKNEAEKKLLLDFADKQITLPKRFLPDAQFLSYHRDNVFQE